MCFYYFLLLRFLLWYRQPILANATDNGHKILVILLKFCQIMREATGHRSNNSHSDSGRSNEHEGSREIQGESSLKQEFSFNRQVRKNTENHLKDKYMEIYKDLKAMPADDIIDLLLEELDENDRSKQQATRYAIRVQGLEEQIAECRQALKKKIDAIGLLCETESRNLQLIEKLENKLSKKGEFARDTHYEKKYQELSVYMNEYIRNINTAQDQFKRAYSTLKAQNANLIRQIETTRNQQVQSNKRINILTQKMKRVEAENAGLNEYIKDVTISLNMLKQQNQVLKKEIEVCQENIRITDRLQVHFSQEHNQLSSDLDFIRDKICENQHISKDIIEKLEESSSNCEKINRTKEQVLDCLQACQERNAALENQIVELKSQNAELEEKLTAISKECEYLLQDKDDLEMQLDEEKLQKEAFRRELLCLAEKVKLMESTYRKEIEQSEKIKGELFRFWENKEKKQGTSRENSGRVLGEIKLNECQHSQSTVSQSEKSSKLSMWHKKSEETSSNIHEKQNHHIEYSEDSLSN